MPRLAKFVIVVAVVAVFLVVSAGLARVLSAASAERGAIDHLIKAQARGDVPRMLELLTGCSASPACRAQARANAARLRRSGKVKLLNLDPSTRFVLGSSHGVTRVAWTVVGRLPVVQCVWVRRTGDVVSGMGVQLTRLSAPIGRQDDCPKG